MTGKNVFLEDDKFAGEYHSLKTVDLHLNCNVRQLILLKSPSR